MPGSDVCRPEQSEQSEQSDEHDDDVGPEPEHDAPEPAS